jgi:hypothetical protein
VNAPEHAHVEVERMGATSGRAPGWYVRITDTAGGVKRHGPYEFESDARERADEMTLGNGGAQ